MERWARDPAARDRGLSLVMLELVGALATHVIEVIAGAGVLYPWVSALGTVAQLVQFSSPLPTSFAPLDETAHGGQDASSEPHDHAADRVCCLEPLKQVLEPATDSLKRPCVRLPGKLLLHR